MKSVWVMYSRGTDLFKLDKNIAHDEYPINIISLVLLLLQKVE